KKRDVGFGSKGEILAVSRCFPIFPRQRTSPREAHGAGLHSKSNILRSSAWRQKLPLRISARRDCALSRGRPFRSPCRASENSSWGGPQNDASWPAPTRASTICRRELLPLGPAPWEITSYPWGYTRGLHRQTRACKKALFYGAFSKPFYGGGEGGIPRNFQKTF